jgi:hypothetical protein
MVLYAGPKVRGHFHHSSFLSGGAIVGAGNLAIEKGILKSIKPHSGHYMPSCEEFLKLLELFKSWGVNMDNVELGKIKPPKDKKKKNKEKKEKKEKQLALF